MNAGLGRNAPLRDNCNAILETQALSKSFGGFRAVNQVSLRVTEGMIHALIGPNGAGKTTVFNLLTKFLRPSLGRILYRGQDITRLKPAEIARRGIARSFQISAVFPHLSVLENVRVAMQRETGWSFHFWRPERSLARLDERALTLLAEVGLADFAHRPAGSLSYGRKRALEIATTLALEPQLLLLDEPMAGMGHEDVERTARLIRKASQNRTVLMVEHNLKVVANLSDRITVMQHGEILTEGSYAEVSRNPDVIRAYMGAGTQHGMHSDERSADA
ncbi:MAG: branched-chain amino acid transport system ATP-binding protein [Rhodospirillaceae bacterium]|nr:branched-chain amino acid transport system ATP-binding protein [Rhodospirillaceae bacterium]